MIRLRLQRPARRSGVAAIVMAVAIGYFVVSAAAAPVPGRPPAPVIRLEPPGQSHVGLATFTFTDAAPHVTFHCYLNSPPASRCSPKGITYHLPIGLWCFYVYVTNRAGKASLRARRCWAILGRPALPPGRHHPRPRPRPRPVVNFTVGGDLGPPLSPGVSEPLDLTFTNPNPGPITIAAGGITNANIAISSNVAACAASNFQVSQGLTVTVTIPAHTTTPVSLAALGIPQADWPVISMISTSANQDACEGAALTITYSGIEATG